MVSEKSIYVRRLYNEPRYVGIEEKITLHAMFEMGLKPVIKPREAKS